VEVFDLKEEHRKKKRENEEGEPKHMFSQEKKKIYLNVDKENEKKESRIWVFNFYILQIKKL